MKKLITIMAIILALVGCVSNKPIPDGYVGNLATIQDSYKSVSDTKARFFQLAKVDNRDVLTSSSATYEKNYGQGFSMSIVKTQRVVPAIKSTLHIEGITHVAAPILAFGGGMYSVKGVVEVALKSGKTYVVRGVLSENYSAVWLEDSHGNIVSKKIEKKSG